jgi:hypothetical protein
MPGELVQISSYDAALENRTRLRGRLRELDAEIAALQAELWRGKESADEAARLDAAARAMLAGDAVTVAPDTVARLRQIVGEREIAVRALQMAEAEFGREKTRAARDKARELAPQHRACVQRIAKSLAALSAALDDYERVRRQVPGLGSLPEAGFPGIGSLKNPQSPVTYWFRRARKLNLIDHVPLAAE